MRLIQRLALVVWATAAAVSPGHGHAATATAAPATTTTTTTTTTTATTAAPATPSFEVRVVHPAATGRALILIPGLASPASVWDGLLPALCAAHPCHVLQLAGFAGTPATDGHLLARVQADLVRYIADQHLDQPTVIGHSLGGFLGLKLAAMPNSPVGAVAVIDALPAFGALQQPQATAADLQRMAAAVQAQFDAMDDAQFAAGQRAALTRLVGNATARERIAADSARSDRHAVTAAMADMLADDMRPQLPAIHQPVLVLGAWAGSRAYATQATVEALYRQQYKGLEHLTLAMAPDGLHFLMLDQPDWTREQLLAFIH